MLGCSSLQSKHSFYIYFTALQFAHHQFYQASLTIPTQEQTLLVEAAHHVALGGTAGRKPAGLRQQFPKFWCLSPSSHKKTAILGHRVYSVAWFLEKKMVKQGNWDKTGWRSGWEAVMFLFNVVNLNVWLFLSVNLAKCFVGVVWLMFGLVEGSRVCWGCCGFTVWDSVH